METVMVQTAAHYEEARLLFMEYEREIAVDLCFQDFAQELSGLEEMYGVSGYGILIAWMEGTSCGCVAYRSLEPGIAEVRRMYVRPPYRGSGVGRKLLAGLISEVRAAGYHTLRLHTLPTMTAAYALYKSAGFTEIDPYEDVPPDAAKFMELTLSEHRL